MDRKDTCGIIFDCRKCGGCCGPHYVSQQEQEIIDKYLEERGIGKRAHVSIYDKCPYFEGNSCLIYPARPLICRLMGLSDIMPCPKGVRPSESISGDDTVGIIENLFSEGCAEISQLLGQGSPSIN